MSTITFARYRLHAYILASGEVVPPESESWRTTGQICVHAPKATSRIVVEDNKHRIWVWDLSKAADATWWSSAHRVPNGDHLRVQEYEDPDQAIMACAMSFRRIVI